MANAIIYYNSVILSKLKKAYEAAGDLDGLAMLKKFSPVAWRHINFLGYYIDSCWDPITQNMAMEFFQHNVTILHTDAQALGHIPALAA